MAARTDVKYDLRYADEQDAEELADFVNHEHACEYDEKSPSYFRAEGPRVSLTEVIFFLLPVIE